MNWLVVLSLLVAPALGFTEKELECFEKESIYHSGSGQCHKLLRKGPCPSGQWFVLEKPKSSSDSRTKGVCKPDLCPDGEFYWSSTKKCVKESDKERLCGPSHSLELRHNLNGEGQCLCRRDPPYARAKTGPTNQCYKLYTRGPCPPRQIFAFANADADNPTCVTDPCHKEKLEIQLSGKVRTTPVLAKYNGTCYELEGRGPCEDLHVFKWPQGEMLPGCQNIVNQVFYELPQNCIRDVNGECATVITRKKKKSDKYAALLQSLNELR